MFYVFTGPKHWQMNNHWYYFSWDDPQNIETDPTTGLPAGKKVNWLEARNECRKRCMDAVGMETKEENAMIFKFLETRELFVFFYLKICSVLGRNWINVSAGCGWMKMMVKVIKVIKGVAALFFRVCIWK